MPGRQARDEPSHGGEIGGRLLLERPVSAVDEMGQLRARDVLSYPFVVAEAPDVTRAILDQGRRRDARQSRNYIEAARNFGPGAVQASTRPARRWG
jgi:hypothetical protein